MLELRLLFVPGIELGIASEQVHNVLHAEFGDGLATLDGRIGELALGVLQIQDAGFDRGSNGKFVDCYVYGLVKAMDAVYGLFFHELYLDNMLALLSNWQDWVEGMLYEAGTYRIPEWL